MYGYEAHDNHWFKSLEIIESSESREGQKR
jgi:hypothetical protein